jgi:hypothetical protein
VKNSPRAAPRQASGSPKEKNLASQNRFASARLARASAVKTAFGRFHSPSYTSASGVLAPRFAWGARFASRNLPAGFAPLRGCVSTPSARLCFANLLRFSINSEKALKRLPSANFFPSPSARVASSGASPHLTSRYSKGFFLSVPTLGLGARPRRRNARARGIASAEKRSGSGLLLGGLNARARGFSSAGSTLGLGASPRRAKTFGLGAFS